MASSAGYIIASSCDDIVEDQHWLTSAYILFAVPYFVYDIYAMFMCYWYKLRIKGHEADSGAKPLGAALTSYLRREFLMVLHHIVMVTVCFPVSVFWRQGKGDYFQGVMFLAEVSTPWVCLGKILIQDELIPEAAPRRRRQRRGIRSELLVQLSRCAHHPLLLSVLLTNVKSQDNKVDKLRARISFQRYIRDCNILCFMESYLSRYTVPVHTASSPGRRKVEVYVS